MPFRTSPVVAEDEWQLDLEVEDGTSAVLTLNRPDKLNAWSWESTRQLGARADQIRFDERVRAVVLRGEGRAFCAGIDLGMPEDRVTGRSPAEKARNYYEGIRWAHERFKVFAELPQPIVAAVQGYCLGFGFELVLMSDIRVAAEDAVFALPEAQVGVGIDAGGDLRLAHEAGAGWAKLLAFTGRRLDARTAERIGDRAAGDHHRGPAADGHGHRRGDRRQRPAGGAEHQAHHRRLRLPGLHRGHAVRRHERVDRVRLRRHARRVRGQGQEAAHRLRGQVAPCPFPSPRRRGSHAAAGHLRRDHGHRHRREAPASARPSPSSSPGLGAAVGILSRAEEHRLAGVAAVEAVGGPGRPRRGRHPRRRSRWPPPSTRSKRPSGRPGSSSTTPPPTSRSRPRT